MSTTSRRSLSIPARAWSPGGDTITLSKADFDRIMEEMKEAGRREARNAMADEGTPAVPLVTPKRMGRPLGSKNRAKTPSYAVSTRSRLESVQISTGRSVWRRASIGPVGDSGPPLSPSSAVPQMKKESSQKEAEASAANLVSVKIEADASEEQTRAPTPGRKRVETSGNLLIKQEFSGDQVVIKKPRSQSSCPSEMVQRRQKYPSEIEAEAGSSQAPSKAIMRITAYESFTPNRTSTPIKMETVATVDDQKYSKKAQETTSEEVMTPNTVKKRGGPPGSRKSLPLPVKASSSRRAKSAVANDSEGIPSSAVMSPVTSKPSLKKRCQSLGPQKSLLQPSSQASSEAKRSLRSQIDLRDTHYSAILSIGTSHQPEVEKASMGRISQSKANRIQMIKQEDNKFNIAVKVETDGSMMTPSGGGVAPPGSSQSSPRKRGRPLGSKNSPKKPLPSSRTTSSGRAKRRSVRLGSLSERERTLIPRRSRCGVEEKDRKMIVKKTKKTGKKEMGPASKLDKRKLKTEASEKSKPSKKKKGTTKKEKTTVTSTKVKKISKKKAMKKTKKDSGEAKSKSEKVTKKKGTKRQSSSTTEPPKKKQKKKESEEPSQPENKRTYLAEYPEPIISLSTIGGIAILNGKKKIRSITKYVRCHWGYYAKTKKVHKMIEKAIAEDNTFIGFEKPKDGSRKMGVYFVREEMKEHFLKFLEAFDKYKGSELGMRLKSVWKLARQGEFPDYTIPTVWPITEDDVEEGPNSEIDRMAHEAFLGCVRLVWGELYKRAQTEPPCHMCGEHRGTGICGKYRTVSERQERLKELNRCFHCLERHRITPYCFGTLIICRLCSSKNHKTFLCPLLLGR